MNTARIIIWSIVTVMLIILLLYLTFDNVGYNWNTKLAFYTDYKVVSEDAISSENIENLYVNWNSGKINIYKSDNDEIKIVQKANYDLDEENKAQFTTNDSTLNIKEGNHKFQFFFLGFGYRGTILDMYLPEKIYNEIDLKCTSGKINIEDITCNNFKSSIYSGNVYINNLVSKDIDIDVTSGKISIENIETDIVELKTSSGYIDVEGIAKDVMLKTTSGKIYFKDNDLPEKLDAQVTSGTLNIYIPENDGFNIDYEVTSGKFNTDFELYSDISKSGIGKYKNGGNTFTLKVTSGKVYLGMN